MDVGVLARIQDASKIEDGAWLHLTQPGTGEPLYRDPTERDPKEPVRVKVRSIRSHSFRQHQEKQQRQAFEQTKKAKSAEVRNAVVQAIARRQVAENFAAVVMAFENTSLETTGETQPSQADLLAMADKPEFQWLTEQVLVFAQDDGNFVPDPLPEGAPASQISLGSETAS